MLIFMAGVLVGVVIAFAVVLIFFVKVIGGMDDLERNIRE